MAGVLRFHLPPTEYDCPLIAAFERRCEDPAHPPPLLELAMRQVVFAIPFVVSIFALAACDAEPKCRPEEEPASCAGEFGGSGGTGGTGGSGGNPVVIACEEFERTRATDEDPFALAGTVGAVPDPGKGFSAEMRLKSHAAGFTILQFDDGTRQVAVHWPRPLTLFVVDEQVRVTRSRDWLELRSLVNETVAMLHVSTGNDLPGPLEPTPEDGIVLRFVPQCDIGTVDSCGALAVELEGTFGDDTFTVDSGAPGGPRGGYWNILNWTLARQGCTDAGYASVIVAEGYLWNRAD